jgi:gliding motility-associated-like protein
LNFTDLFPGNYSVSVVDNYGCTISQNIVLVNEAGLSNVFIPNVFTPNHDVTETNEVWRVTATCTQTFECQIFNRWGDMVYEFGDINGYWDGRTLKGKDVVDGVYFYKVTLGYYDNTSDVYQGHITVIR